MTDSKVISSVDSRGVAAVTLNNPEKHNAFDDHMIAELSAAFAQLDGDSSVRAMVLAANGKSFSAGGDLNWMKRMANYNYDENLRDARGLAQMLESLNGLSKPTIARVHGPAFGGAVGLVSCCDMAVGTPAASFSLSEVKIGLVPATIAPYVIAAIGQRAARRYFQTAERFSAEQALTNGLLSELVAPEELDQRVDSLLDALLQNGPTAVATAKRLVLNTANQAITAELVEQTCELIAALRVSAEGQEGLGAFLDKRQPVWQVQNKG